MNSPASQARIGRWDLLAVGAVGLIAAGIPLWMAASAGTVGIPSNDDWVYMLGAQNLFNSGASTCRGTRLHRSGSS